MESTNEELNKALNTSCNIFSLYEKLSYAEIKYGKDSEEYKKLSSYIEMSAEVENEYFDSIFRNEKTLSSFRNFWDESYSRKTLSVFQYSFCTMDKDDDLEKYIRMFSSRLQSEVDLRNDNKYLISDFNLIILKNYVLLLDKYISDSKDNKLKSKLIKEKNNIIYSNKSLECWYLGFEKSNMKCSIVDSNIIQAYLYGIGLEDYITYKEDYLSYFCRSIVNNVLLSNLDSFDKIKAEIRLLAVLLDMDCVTLEMNYANYQVLFNMKGYHNCNSDFVDEVFAKCPELAKKKKNYSI